MKSKLFILTAAMVSAMTLSSCLGDSEDFDYPDYERIVTVGSGATKLLSDDNIILKPVNTITGLDKVERAVVSFHMYPKNLKGTELKEGETYDVELDPNFSFSVPTSAVINLRNNEVAKDSLVNTQTPIINVAGMNVKNGYLTASLIFAMRQYAPYYVDMAYDSETDVDLETNTITFTLYYDNKSVTSNTQVNYPFCFRMPAALYLKFKDASSINVVLRFMQGIGGEMGEMRCTMKPEDFNIPNF